jgi:hypothetical protein
MKDSERKRPNAQSVRVWRGSAERNNLTVTAKHILQSPPLTKSA